MAYQTCLSIAWWKMNCGKKMKILLVGLNARYVHSCLALFYVRNELAKRGVACDVLIYQGTINDNYHELLLRLSGSSPDYIFFSAAIWNSELVTRLSLDLPKCLPEVGIVIGGPQTAAMSNANIGNSCLVSGPIEEVDDSFFDDLQSRCLKPRYRVGQNTLISVRGKGDATFGFPYLESDFSRHLKNRNIYYESSRGCPFRCSYCLSASDTRVTHKGAEVVEQELALVLQSKPKTLRFVDRTFNDLPERALAIWRYLVGQGGDTLCHFEMAPDRFTGEMLSFLSTVPSGKFQFEIGIQSTNQETLSAIDRKMDLSVAAKNIQALAATGNIHLHADLILGLPYETEETFAQSFRDIFAMGAHYIQMGLLKILPDTPISRQADEFAYIFQDGPPYSVLANKWLSHSRMTNLYWFCECVEKFVNNRYFVSLWHYLRSDGTDVFAFFQDLLRVGQRAEIFERAPTQEYLTSLLVQATAHRDDAMMIVELLRYDWLRCGFRYLPEILRHEPAVSSHEELRTELYKTLPDTLAGAYDPANRNYFFRKTYFLQFSQGVLQRLGYQGGEGQACLGFLQERDCSIFGFHKTVLI